MLSYFYQDSIQLKRNNAYFLFEKLIDKKNRQKITCIEIWQWKRIDLDRNGKNINALKFKSLIFTTIIVYEFKTVFVFVAL